MSKLEWADGIKGPCCTGSLNGSGCTCVPTHERRPEQAVQATLPVTDEQRAALAAVVVGRIESERLEAFRQGARKCMATVAEYGDDMVKASDIYERLRQWAEEGT